MTSSPTRMITYDPEADDPFDGDLLRLTDYDVLPDALAANLAGGRHFEIRDPLSFPFEDVGPDFWTTPLLVRLPDISGEDARSLFDELLFRRLTVCDLLTASVGLRDQLQQHYGFPKSMFVAADHRRSARDLEIADRVAVELRRRHSPLYSEWPLATPAYKERLVVATDALSRAIAEARPGPSASPTVELRGWNVRRFVPSVWSGLRRIVEYRPIIRDRLAVDHGETGVALVAPGKDVKPLGVDVGVGIDHLKLAGAGTAQRRLRSLFQSVQSGGRLVLVETFDGDRRPNDYIDLLLEVSTHRLVMESVSVLSCPDDEVASAAVFSLTKLGRRV